MVKMNYQKGEANNPELDLTDEETLTQLLNADVLKPQTGPPRRIPAAQRRFHGERGRRLGRGELARPRHPRLGVGTRAARANLRQRHVLAVALARFGAAPGGTGASCTPLGAPHASPPVRRDVAVHEGVCKDNMGVVPPCAAELCVGAELVGELLSAGLQQGGVADQEERTVAVAINAALRTGIGLATAIGVRCAAGATTMGSDVVNYGYCALVED